MSDQHHSSEVGRPDDDGGAMNLPERFENPGLEPHRHRLGDSDPKIAKRSERQIVFIFLISVLASIGGLVGYFLIPVDEPNVLNVRLSTLVLGLGLGLGMLGIGVAAVQWARALMDDTEKIEDRHPMSAGSAVQQQAFEMLRDGAKEANVARRPVLKGAVGGALALAPLVYLVPLIGNLGADWDISKFAHTAWRPVRGGDPEMYYQGQFRYLALDPQDTRIRAADVTNNNIVHVIPRGLPEQEHYLEEKAKAVVLLVRVDPALLKESPERASWSYDGIVAYSKICTHVGCPVALYEQQTHHLLCPCHQSTFDITDAAKVVFGPAKRALPQLPIAVDEEGYLYATADFDEPVGPSYWQRER
ncbi:cytochrome bc1 complex Rieske iron-sulfur subunit [Pseudactinotalea suaedae]|uniref:cytochrome bc1 complex Rieske iron-sulfur subunit n=1 Tax=Pseudactinotalea suaedae TaxID=1524924 RepID=UPI0012E25B5E|nr:Rieske 2Fe-2S domain-containing protein [Pseudactinotalea suaedae]